MYKVIHAIDKVSRRRVIMSGGSYDYAYHYVSDFSLSCVLPDYPYEGGEREKSHLELRVKFANHLKKVGEVMRVIEWVDSGDLSDDSLEKAITDFFNEINT